MSLLTGGIARANSRRPILNTNTAVVSLKPVSSERKSVSPHSISPYKDRRDDSQVTNSKSLLYQTFEEVKIQIDELGVQIFTGMEQEA